MIEDKTPLPSDADIPEKIFKQFIDELRKEDLTATIADNLEQVLLIDGNINETNLREAITIKENDDKSQKS